MIAARNAGTLSEQQFRHNCISIFLAGHENPQLLLTSMIFLLGKNPEAQARLRREILASSFNSWEPVSSCSSSSSHSNSLLQSLPYLTSVIYETLRLFPPISQLINRRTTTPVLLGGTVPIPAGTYIGYNAYATGRDASAWGPDANDFRPERWGKEIEEIQARYRRVSARGEFIAFHGGKRKCLGEKFAMWQIRWTMAMLVREVSWGLDKEWDGRMTPVSLTIFIFILFIGCSCAMLCSWPID